MVYQDVRGRYMSEGTFIDVPPHKTQFNGPKDTDESTDTWDTIDWLVKNVPNNNGKVGIWGISYPGFFAAFGLMNAHPALEGRLAAGAHGRRRQRGRRLSQRRFPPGRELRILQQISSRVPASRHALRICRASISARQDHYDFYLRMGPLANANKLYLKDQNPYWNQVLQHPNYDEFWQSRAQSPHMKHVTPATLFVGGWFDAEDLAGPLKLFYAVEENGPMASNTLVMGPWSHGGWARGHGADAGRSEFRVETGEYFREKIELAFFVQESQGQRRGEVPEGVAVRTGH